LTCDVARFCVPWFALALLPVVVVEERVVGMMVVVVVEGVSGRGCVCVGTGVGVRVVVDGFVVRRFAS